MTYYENTTRDIYRTPSTPANDHALGILLLSVGDQDYKNENGESCTMPGVMNLPVISKILRPAVIAFEYASAFKDPEAKGKTGSCQTSMAKLHLYTYKLRGGAHLADRRTADAKEQYDRRRLAAANNQLSILASAFTGMLSTLAYLRGNRTRPYNRYVLCIRKTTKLIKPLREMNR